MLDEGVIEHIPVPRPVVHEWADILERAAVIASVRKMRVRDLVVVPAQVKQPSGGLDILDYTDSHHVLGVEIVTVKRHLHLVVEGRGSSISPLAPEDEKILTSGSGWLATSLGIKRLEQGVEFQLTPESELLSFTQPADRLQIPDDDGTI